MQGNGETDSSTSLGMTMAITVRHYTREYVANDVRRYKIKKSKQKGEFDQ